MGFTHTVVQGECLSSIAYSYGFSDWRTVYDHAQNADFRARRPNPNLIYPGDEVYIPDRESKQDDKPTDKKHRYEVSRPKTKIRICVLDGQWRECPGKRYKLDVGANSYEGVVKPDGVIEEDILPTADTGTLTVFLHDQQTVGYTWELVIGHLDPVEYLTGVQARLNNLGFNSGPVDGIFGPLTKASVIEFQKKYKLKADGIPGPVTQGKLKDVHGS